jgi:hypothetical protein
MKWEIEARDSSGPYTGVGKSFTSLRETVTRC